jgi:indolepyruvate ferredoxin oxidoreductase
MSAARIAQRCAHVVLGADALVVGSQDVLPLVHRIRSKIVLNTAAIATGEFTKQADQKIPVETIIQNFLNEGLALETLNFSRVCEHLLGDMLATNIIILGFAYQKGLIPVHHDSIIEAMHLNKSGLSSNLKAFWIGRRMAFDSNWFDQFIKQNDGKPAAPKTLDEKIKFRVEFLINYQDVAYAQNYLDFINKVAATDVALGLGNKLTEATCLYLFKLMAYKDEYEVARLYTQTDFLESIDSQIDGQHKVYFHLAPPLFAPKDPRTGHLRKIKFKPWILKAFKFLAKLKGLRGTRFDLFGYTQERKIERQLIDDYKKLIIEILETLKAHPSLLTYDHAIKMANFPDMIRGFGHVKEASIHKAMDTLKQLQKSWPSV